jgi:hypothetical protein
MTAIRVPVFVSLALSLLAVPAWGAANVSVTATFFSVDAACDLPVYTFNGTADFTSNDDGAGNDYVAFVFYDESGNYHDVDFNTVQTPADAISGFDDFLPTLPFSSFLQSRPLMVRVHDIGAPGLISENSKAGIEFASAAPVLFTLSIDPANNAAACSAKQLSNWALRIESMRNGGGQLLTTVPTALDLDGAGSTALTVAIPQDSNLIAMYKAECVNDAANNGTFANVDLRVDGIPLSPTNSADAFCTSNGTPVFDEWVMPRTSGVIALLGPSVHTIDVIGRGTAGNTFLGDSELVVMVPEPASWLQRGAGLAAVLLLAARRRRRTGVAAVCLALIGAGVAPTSASAGTVLLHTQNGANQAATVAAGPTLLNLGGGTSFPVNLARNARVAILFSAECTASTASASAWVDLDIRVDGIAVPESDDTDDAFCTSTGGGADWVSSGIHVTQDLAAGAHTVEVRAQLQNSLAAGDQWGIGDLSLTVIGQEF